MTTALKYLKVFWIAAILLMAGGQLVHAWEELSCLSEHAEHASEKGSHCPSNHECCQAHPQGAMDLVRTAGLPGIKHAFVFLAVTDDATLEGFRQKITYPPRVS